MTKNLNDTISKLIENMDNCSLKQTIIHLSDALGMEKAEEIVRDIALNNADESSESVTSRAIFALDMDEREWYSIADHDEYGDYVYSSERACDLVQKLINDEFEDDLKNIMNVSPEKAEGFILAIMEGLRKSDSNCSKNARTSETITSAIWRSAWRTKTTRMP